MSKAFPATPTSNATDPRPAARAAGLLLHPTSLPSRYGVGDLGPGAVTFLDWAREAGQSVWQVLPLGPTGMGQSPYNCLSAFAGSPLLISPERLGEDELLSAEEASWGAGEPTAEVDFARAEGARLAQLRAAWERFRRQPRSLLGEEFLAFRSAPEQHRWLADWALFSTLKAAHAGREWSAWDLELRRREPAALAAARARANDEIDFHAWVQFLFFRQWEALRGEAEARAIRILGDLPLYVAHDSADVWANPELFQLDAEGLPTAVAGVPPDYFSATGQLWGNPLYRWDAMAREGFPWWIARVRHNLRLTHLVRLDHFRGFAGYWAVPAGEKTAVRGRWEPAPGRALFAALAAALGDLPLIAEDLGVITPDVVALRREFDLPGMKVLQFGFGRDSSHAPHRHEARGVVYTGTHDNDTTCGWFAALPASDQRRVLDYVGGQASTIGWDLIRIAYTSVCDLAIVPLQDILGLGSAARMNTPGRAAGNWAWRLHPAAARVPAREYLHRLADLTARLPEAPPPPSSGDAGEAAAASSPAPA